jgi:hypothetical protein
MLISILATSDVLEASRMHEWTFPPMFRIIERSFALTVYCPAQEVVNHADR